MWSGGRGCGQEGEGVVRRERVWSGGRGCGPEQLKYNPAITFYIVQYQLGPSVQYLKFPSNSIKVNITKLKPSTQYELWRSACTNIGNCNNLVSDAVLLC